MCKNTQQGKISRPKCFSRENFRENLRNWTDIHSAIYIVRCSINGCFLVVHRDCQVPEVFAFDEHCIDGILFATKLQGI